MKTWIGLVLALIGVALGLASTVLIDFISSHPNQVNIFGISAEVINTNTPSLVGLSLLLLIVSFYLVYSSKRRKLRAQTQRNVK